MTTSRDKILAAVKQNQPALMPLPDVPSFKQNFPDEVAKFRETLQSIGGTVHVVSSSEEILTILTGQFGAGGRLITTIRELTPFATYYDERKHPHLLENVEVAIIEAHFGVAENGSVWVSDALLPNRAIPFISQHLVVVLDQNSILPSMHEAYSSIGAEQYDFGVFIAGPSKTADIEQSLVLGAHGPKTMTVFLQKRNEFG